MFMTKSRFEHALKVASLDAINSERKHQLEQKNQSDFYTLESFVGQLVIVLSNEVENLKVCYAKGIDFITQSNSPVLVVIDLVSKKEFIVFGKVFAYTKQKFDALNSLDPNARISLFYESDSNSIYHKSSDVVVDSPDIWAEKVQFAMKDWFCENEHPV